MIEWGPEWGKYANDPAHDHMACATCLPERLNIVANMRNPEMNEDLSTTEKMKLAHDLRWIEDQIDYIRTLKVRSNVMVELVRTRGRMAVMIEELIEATAR